ncbi:ppdK, partial [Symbiodinium necroappetens]
GEGKIGHKGGKGSKGLHEGQETKGAAGSQGKGKGKNRGDIGTSAGGEWEVIAWHAKPAAFGCTRLITGIEALEAALEASEKILVQVPAEDFCEAASIMDGGCPLGSVLIKDGEACGVLDELQKKWPVSRQHVPGTMGGNPRLRRVWVCTFGSAASLAPALDFVKAPAPKRRRNEDTVVLRCTAWRAFAEAKDFQAMLKKPGQTARAWYTKVAPLCIQEFIDSWGWQSFGDDQVKGLIRLTKEAALTALRSSGCWANGVSLFFAALDWGQVDVSEAPALLWIDMEAGEEAKDYVQRVRKEAACHGLHCGGDRLAVRLDQLDPRILPQKAAWHLRGARQDWLCDDVEAVLSSAGFSEVTIEAKLLRRGQPVWEFRGLRQDFRDFVPIELEDGEVDMEGGMVLEAARVQRRRKTGDAKVLPLERVAKFGAVDVAELVKKVAAPKRRSRFARSKEDAAATAPLEDMDVDGEAVDDGTEVGQKRRQAEQGGSKGDFESSEPAPKRASKSVVLPEGAVAHSNAGGGDCLFHCLADVLSSVTKKRRGHRAVRASIASWMESHVELLEPHWDHIAPDGSVATGSFGDYCKQIREDLNILLLCPDHTVKFPARNEQGHFAVFKYEGDVVTLENQEPGSPVAASPPKPQELRPRKSKYRVGDVARWPCPLCPMVIENKSVRSLCKLRYTHCHRHHGGQGLPGARRVNLDAFRALQPEVTLATAKDQHRTAKLWEAFKEAKTLDHGVAPEMLLQMFVNADLAMGGVAAIHDHLEAFPCQVMCLQEVDINSASVVVVSVYGHAADGEMAASYVEEIVTGVRALGLEWLVLGDYNVAADEGPMARRLAAGLAEQLDWPFMAEGPLPGTAGGQRRLDYGLSSGQLFPSALSHAEGIANHTAVSYEFAFDDPVGCSGPSRASLSTSSVSASAWDDRWDASHFQALLFASDLDGAWRLLSDTAEAVLSGGGHGVVARSSGWSPQKAKPRSKASRCFESLELVRLRRLSRRLTQLARHPEDTRLRDIIGRAVAELQGSFSWLGELPHFTMEQHAEWVQTQVEIVAQAERAVRRRAIHPVEVIKRAEEEWCPRWTAGEVNELPVQSLLEALDPPRGGTIAMPCFTPAKLQRAASKMVGKASGPDGWEMREWADDWLGHRMLGGVHKRSTRDVFLRIVEACEDPEMVFVGQDVSKYFDSIHGAHLCQVLTFLRAPEQFVSFVHGVLEEQWRIFTVGGRVGNRWHRATRGLAQGDPLSPLLAASIMAVWTATVATSGCEAVTFVDDRSFWGRTLVELSSAKALSDGVDAAFQFRCDTTKCQVASAEGEVGFRAAELFGYSHSGEFETLGVRFFLQQGRAPQLARYSIEIANTRLGCIGVVAAGLPVQALFIKSLVLPLMAWAGAMASIEKEQLHQLRRAVLAMSNCKSACDTPALARWEVLGWDCNPVFARRWSAIRAAILFACRPPCWLEEASIRLAARRWPSMLPVAAAVLGELGWWASPCGSTIFRRDLRGHLRAFHVGFDNEQVIKEWLVDWHRRATLEDTIRVKKRLHRGEEEGDLAQGDLLPGVPAGSLVVLAGHRKLFHSGGDRHRRNSALATGCSVWAKAAKKGVKVETIATCMCGRRMPSRPHLLWRCDATAHLRPRCAPPVNRAEERMLCRVVPELPAAPGVVGEDEVIDGLAAELEKQLGAEAVVFVATDGSCVKDVAAWAVAVQDGPVFCSGVIGEDQSPYRAEVEGIR